MNFTISKTRTRQERILETTPEQNEMQTITTQCHNKSAARNTPKTKKEQNQEHNNNKSRTNQETKQKRNIEQPRTITKSKPRAGL